MNAKISVIVPIYNVEKYLCKCVDSIINQTYTNLEIILIEDGSPDNSGMLCDEYLLKDYRIKVIHKKNGGLSDARNAGLDIAVGDYVSFIDSDDYIHKDFYKILINLIIKHNADIAQCEFLDIYEEDLYNFSNDKLYINEKVTLLNNNEAINNLFNENYVNTVVVWNKLYKRELFENIRYPKGKIHEDEYTTYKLLFNAKKVVSISQQMYYYLRRSSSIMGKGFNIKSLDKLDAYYEQILFYNNRKLFEIEEKAKNKFEFFIKESMINVLESNLDDKNKVFYNLINYYRNNYILFINKLNISFKKKVNILLFKYSPKFSIKLLYNLMYLRKKLIRQIRTYKYQYLQNFHRAKE